MNKFLTSNTTGWRLARTIVQGILGVLVANIDLLIEKISINCDLKPMIVACVMCILSPIMAEIGKCEPGRG